VSGDLALDFGSATTRVADARGRIVLEEPTVAAVDADTERLLAFGSKAPALVAATAGRVSLVRPVRHGQLVDIGLAEEVLVEVLGAAGASRLAHPRVLACVSSAATHVQRRALDRALRKAGARQVRFIEQPVACAVGAGLPIEEPTGSMVVDVGAGTTDIGVLALGGLVTHAALAVGTDDVDEALRVLLARRYDLVVDRETAAEVCRRIGSLRVAPDLSNIEVTGRATATGRPHAVVLGPSDVRPTIVELLNPIFDAAVNCIATAPPDLANDLLGAGCHLSGGGSSLDGLGQSLAAATGLAVRVAADPRSSAVLGAARCLTMLDLAGVSLSAAPRR
jgi:rod shape-determining protein MreB